MRYSPSFTMSMQRKDEKELVQQKSQELNRALDQMYNLPRNPISDHTNFLVTATTVDTSKMDDRFNERNALLLLAIDKFNALAALEPRDETLLEYIWQDLKYAITFEFWDRAEKKALEIIKYCNISRGRANNYNFSEQMITTREVLISKHKQEQAEAQRKGSWGFMRKKESVVPAEQILMEK